MNTVILKTKYYLKLQKKIAVSKTLVQHIINVRRKIHEAQPIQVLYTCQTSSTTPSSSTVAQFFEGWKTKSIKLKKGNKNWNNLLDLD
jgi:isochorismate hydrolase